MSAALGMKLDEAELNMLRSKAHFAEGSCHYCVWAVLYKSTECTPEEIRTFVKEAFSEDMDFMFWDAFETTVFAAAGSNGKALVDNGLENVCERCFFERGKTLCAISEGNVFSDFAELPLRIKKCVELANEFKLTAEPLSPGVRYAGSSSVLSTMVSPADISSILRLFEKGKFDELDTELDIKVEEIRKNNSVINTDIQPTSIKRFFVELITFAAHTAYDYGVDVDELMNYEDPYQVIFSMDETPKIKTWFMQSCRKLYSACQETAAQDKDRLVSAVEKYIRDNVFRADFGVAEIAETFNLSPAYLSNCYSTARGSTIIKYINQLRLENACRYLEQTDDAINEVCRKAGYSSINYFYSVFRKKYGQTPTDYRKNLKNQQ